jgi:DNA invertase Pin-like site-specific DNA recombinase
MTSLESDNNAGPPCTRPDHHSRGRLASTLLSSKIGSRHLDRIAVVYVRQSSVRQVVENRESTQLQYRLRDRAVALGWSESRVVVIDDDLGQSGQSIAGRPGFQRLLAEVGLDHVGLVLGIEMSRLARSCRDWHQLLELCALFGTLLGDADGVYDPHDHNDRLLLGLKGTMSEAELHVLRGRMEAGKRNKAQRGELFTHAPIGYVRSAEGSLVFDPDEQARGVVELIFAKFADLGSVAAVLRYLNDHQIRVGVRDHRGPEACQLRWRPPNRATLQGMLHHPAYAGTYAHGRRATNPRKRIEGRAGSGRFWAAPADWLVVLHDRLPAYISWERYEANQMRLRDNSAKFGRGAPRDGCSLLGGLVICGRCGRRMSIEYTNRNKPRLTCNADRNHLGASQCQALIAQPVEMLVARQVLIALEPVSLELSLAAADQVEAERRRLQDFHEQGLERARYEAERAWRQYAAVEPEHRLVAHSLERNWEEALANQRAAEEALDRFRRERPVRLTGAERAQIQELAATVPSLWNAPETRPSHRQMIVRQLIEHVEVSVLMGTEHVEATIRWAGGYESRHELRRPVSSYKHLQDGDLLRSRVRDLKREGLCHAEIACRLTTEGFRGPSGQDFTVPMVSYLCKHVFATDESRMPATVSAPADQPVDTSLWRCSALSRHVGVPPETLNTWRRRGWVHARRVGNRWIYWANATELRRLTRLHSQPRVALSPAPSELTTPTGSPSWHHDD